MVLLAFVALAGDHAVRPPLGRAASHKHDEADTERHDRQTPCASTADDADAGCEPGRGGAGQPVDTAVAVAVHDDAGAEKADPGQDALDHAASGVRNSSR